MQIWQARAVVQAALHAIDSTSSELAHLTSPLSWRTGVIALLACLVGGAQAVFSPNSVPTALELGMFALYALSCLTLGLLLYSSRPRLLLVAVAAGLLFGLALSLGPAPLLGALILELIAIAVLYRLPGRWSLPIVMIAAIIFLVTQYRHFFIVASSPTAAGDFWKLAVAFLLLPTIAVALRSRALVVQRLRATQTQLEAEMERTAELAVARERARIARDMHDVLAHSLTVLSIQAQAARQVVTEQPERAAAMLDDIVDMLRQSIAESRRLVGVLREAERTGSGDSPLGERLLALANRFGERSGVRCSLTESGEARAIGEPQESALRFALQEALTNAYRHGQARQVWITLNWSGGTVTLSVRDDGAGKDQAGIMSDGGGHGLRGMRERASALGGTLSVGPGEDGGYLVCVSLPLAGAETGAGVRSA